MAAPWHPPNMVNNSRYVARAPRLCLALRPLAGHSGRACDFDGADAAPMRTKPGLSGPATALILEELPMPDAVKVGFAPFSAAARGILVVFCDDALKFGDATAKALGPAADLVGRVAAAN